jgi:MoaA/NifB/PqqE/SkfB family radical SAM enzyme
VPVERWLEVTKDLQKTGANIVVYSGGEPMLRYDDLVRLIEAGDKTLSDFHVHTSGIGLTYEKALRLKAAGLQAAGIGLEDSNPKRHDTFRGFRGAFQAATEALKNFNRASVFTYTNMCLKKELIQAGDLPAYFKLVRDLGVGAVVFLEPKLCGSYLAQNQDDLFSADERQTVTEFFKEANSGKKHRDYPLISYIAYFEDPQRFGCMMGGLSHLYVDSLGNVQPCLYLPVSFGNILKESFEDIIQNIRNAAPAPLHKQCPSVLLSKKIRARKGRGLSLPLPYQEIEEEWQRLFSQSS